MKAKMTKLKLPYFGQGSLEKTTVQGKTEGSRKKGRPNVTGIDVIKGPSA